MKYFKTILAALLLLWYFQWLRHENYFSFLDYINLAFHEAGHVFLGPFGETIGILGGTIFQLLFPAVIGGHFLITGQELGWRLCVFWLGENMLNISIYMKDAIRQNLPLAGGGVHDWTWFFGKYKILAHCEKIGASFFAAGSLIIFLSLYLIAQDPPKEYFSNFRKR